MEKDEQRGGKTSSITTRTRIGRGKEAGSEDSGLSLRPTTRAVLSMFALRSGAPSPPRSRADAASAAPELQRFGASSLLSPPSTSTLGLVQVS